MALSDYSHYIDFTISGSKVLENGNYAVLITEACLDAATKTSFFSIIDPTGKDIIFSNQGETVTYEHDLFKCNVGSEHIRLRVRTPDVAASKIVRMHFGYSSATDPSTTNVYSNTNCIAYFWNGQDDRTANANDLTLGGDAQIVNDKLEINLGNVSTVGTGRAEKTGLSGSSVLQFKDKLSVYHNVNCVSSSGNHSFIDTNGISATTPHYYGNLTYSPSKDLRSRFGASLILDSPNNQFNYNTEFIFAVAKDENGGTHDVRGFANGVITDNVLTGTSNLDNQDTFMLGNRVDLAQHLQGYISHSMYFDVFHSDNKVATYSNNHLNPATFITGGAVTAKSTGSTYVDANLLNAYVQTYQHNFKALLESGLSALEVNLFLSALKSSLNPGISELDSLYYQANSTNIHNANLMSAEPVYLAFSLAAQTIIDAVQVYFEPYFYPARYASPIVAESIDKSVTGNEAKLSASLLTETIHIDNELLTIELNKALSSNQVDFSPVYFAFVITASNSVIAKLLDTQAELFPSALRKALASKQANIIPLLNNSDIVKSLPGNVINVYPEYYEFTVSGEPAILTKLSAVRIDAVKPLKARFH